jgi:tRNA-Thr(GGU) m(6)t(6)A37 methyltransferase TsaA
MKYTMQPIGVIHTPYQKGSDAPIQSALSKTTGRVVVYPQYIEGLQDLEGFSHVYLFYVFHCSSGYSLKVKPFLDDNLRGLFATRYPCRPNPIGISIVRLISLNENGLEFEGADMLDETPLLDIKPYVPDFDAFIDVSTGWYESRSTR